MGNVDGGTNDMKTRNIIYSAITNGQLDFISEEQQRTHNFKYREYKRVAMASTDKAESTIWRRRLGKHPTPRTTVLGGRCCVVVYDA